jgi:hypothetical protein
MKIAVLFFGQPRFFDVTAPFFRKYLYLKSHSAGVSHPVPASDKSYVSTQIDFFAHLWDTVGYSPKNPEETVDKDKLIDILETQFSVKRYRIDNYDTLDKFAYNMQKFHNTLHGLFDNTEGYSKQLKDLHDGIGQHTNRYSNGQYYSLGEVFNLMEEYELENGFKYDIILRLRTDYLINKLDIEHLFSFGSLHKPIMKGCAPMSLDSIRHKKNQLDDSSNYKLQTITDIGRKGWAGYGVYRGDIRIRDHLWCYNRLGAEVFIRNYWKYYFLMYVHDQLNIPIPMKYLNERYTIVNRNKYWGCESLSVLISGLTDADVETLPHVVIRVNHSTTKSKFKIREDVINLDDYSSFNDNNEKFLDVIDKQLNLFTIRKDTFGGQHLTKNEQ